MDLGREEIEDLAREALIMGRYIKENPWPIFEYNGIGVQYAGGAMRIYLDYENDPSNTVLLRSTDIANLYAEKQMEVGRGNVPGSPAGEVRKQPYWVLESERPSDVREMLNISKEDAERLVQMRTEYPELEDR